MSTPQAASWSRSNGTPISERGSARSAPRDQTAERAAVGVDEVGPERGGQGDPLGAPVEHRLGTDVDGEAGDLRAAQLAAEDRGALQQQHVAPGRGEVAGRGQPGMPPPTDDHRRRAR